MNINCHLQKYRFGGGAKVKLRERLTMVAPALYRSKAHYRDLLDQYRGEISYLQNILYAHDRYALLLIFQGMDTSGKDGAIRHVMSGVNPQGCQVFSFKQPSTEELDHDFLWRTNKCLPERGRIGIFNRSYYEEVLVARVDPEVLRRQRLPEELVKAKKIWHQRYSDIVNLEDYLYRNGTRVVKFFLHLSKEEQRRRFLARIDDPQKNWKLSASDIAMRRHWEAFEAVYEDCLSATSTPRAPWYIVPADDKWSARLIISQAVLAALKAMPMRFPVATKAHRKELKKIRLTLERKI